MNNIFDSHAHYCDRAFDGDREELLNALPQRGVSGVVTVSSNLEDSEESVRIAEKWSYIYAAAGIHPEFAEQLPDGYIKKLENILRSSGKVKALGEIGLDYHYDSYCREKQISVFKEQLELAQKLELPVIIHSRNASEDTMNILRQYKPFGVVHCFSGSAETAREVISLGMYISFTGVLTFKNAKKAVKALAEVPLDRLMLETDCPYMAPVPYRGERCDSAMIEKTAGKAAEIKGVSVQDMLDLTCENAERFFDLH